MLSPPPGAIVRAIQSAAGAASALSHPNIVTIHEIEAEGDVDFLVMEYVAGRSLDTLIPRRKCGPGRSCDLTLPAHCSRQVRAGLRVRQRHWTPLCRVKLEWDRPIRDVVPSTQFFSDDLNRSITLRDMLAHRTGITRHDAV